MTSGKGLLVVGGAAPTSPPAPPILPGVGKDGLAHRWHAAFTAYYNLATDGVTATGWNDAIATSPDNLQRAVFETGSPEPVVGYDTVSGQSIPYVRFAGIDLAGGVQLAPPMSFFLVFRTSVLLTQVSRIVGASVSRSSNGRVRVVFGGGTTAVGAAGTNTNNWHSVVVNADTTNATTLIDGVYATWGTYTAGPAGNAYTVHQMGDTFGTGTATTDIRDHGTFPFGLASADMTAVYTALKSQYPDLP